MADTNLLVLAREYKKLREEVKKVLSMPKGDKGDQGLKGDKGDKGDTGPQGFPGRDGKDGINGYDGKEGRNGVDGKDGKDGLDGVGVQNAYIDFDNSLVIVLTDGREVNAGFLSQEAKDNVVATFKQGAQTLNELLPVQTGNAGKFLTTDGTNTAWVTVSSGGGGVTEVTGTSPVVSSGGDTPAISLASEYGDTQNPYGSKTANFVLAAPNGTNGAPTFRALAASDIPTLTSNRIDPRVSSAASTATLTPDISAFDQYNLTAQAVGLTVAAPIGTPVDGNKLIIRILDNGTTRTINWNGTYTAIGVTLPTATTANKMIYVGCVYNSANTRWDVIALTTQA
jgi:hypothetical protein